MGELGAVVQAELDRISQALTERIRLLARRYDMPLPMLSNNMILLSGNVDAHLKKMGFIWK
jgi:type I restriction enzyme M protein